MNRIKKLLCFFVLMQILAPSFGQQLQFCVYNKYGQRQGGCYTDKKACENVVANYNKSNGSMGLFCQGVSK